MILALRELFARPRASAVSSRDVILSSRGSLSAPRASAQRPAAAGDPLGQQLTAAPL